MRGPDVGTMLARALVALASEAGRTVEIVEIESDAWASATFSGARHRIVLCSADAAFTEWLGELPEEQFTLNGHLVADIAIDSVRRDESHQTASIGALTVIES